MRYGKKWVLMCLLVFCISCGAKVDPTVVYQGTYESYVRVLNEWTRSRKVYEPSFDTIMVVTATYESRAFREAFLAEKIHAESILPDEAARLVNKSNDELSREAVFFVSFYTPKYSWNKLELTDPSWRLWVIDGAGRKVGPLKIEKVSNIQAATARYYTYYDEWSNFYQVSFPRKTDKGAELSLEKGKVTLLIAGVYGTAALVWEIP